MKVHELIKSFSGKISLPVDVNEVLDVLKANGSSQDIEFIGVDFDPEVLQGAIKVFYSHDALYGEPNEMVNIYYHRGHPNYWQRFIACKELIHLLDPASARVSTPTSAQELAAKIGLPPEMQDPLNDGLATNVDRMAEWRAAAILLPLAARDLLLEPLHEGKLKLPDIARLADIPGRYAGFVMSSIWPQVHNLLTSEAGDAA